MTDIFASVRCCSEIVKERKKEREREKRKEMKK
jgi:hypothetical protein